MDLSKEQCILPAAGLSFLCVTNISEHAAATHCRKQQAGFPYSVISVCVTYL